MVEVQAMLEVKVLIMPKDYQKLKECTMLGMKITKMKFLKIV